MSLEGPSWLSTAWRACTWCHPDQVAVGTKTRDPPLRFAIQFFLKFRDSSFTFRAMFIVFGIHPGVCWYSWRLIHCLWGPAVPDHTLRLLVSSNSPLISSHTDGKLSMIPELTPMAIFGLFPILTRSKRSKWRSYGFSAMTPIKSSSDAEEERLIHLDITVDIDIHSANNDMTRFLEEMEHAFGWVQLYSFSWRFSSGTQWSPLSSKFPEKKRKTSSSRFLAARKCRVW